MLILISPAKTYNLKFTQQTFEFTTPEFLNQAQKLVSEAKKLNPSELQALLKINHEKSYTPGITSNYRNFCFFSKNTAAKN